MVLIKINSPIDPTNFDFNHQIEKNIKVYEMSVVEI